MTPRGVLAFCREKEVKAVDIRYVDLLGAWHHLTIPTDRLTESSFEHGLGLSSSILPGQPLVDRCVIPRPGSAFLDPFNSVPTLILVGTLQDPVTREDDLLDSRIVAERSVEYLQRTGIADRAIFGNVFEFSIFQEVHTQCLGEEGSFAVQRVTNDDSNLELRNAVLEASFDTQVPIVQHRSLLPKSCRQAIALESIDLVSAADALQGLKYLVRRCAQQRQQIACFMPQPTMIEQGVGVQLALSLFRNEETTFSGQFFGGLSEVAMRALAGILHHLPALTAFANPTTNSYKRLHHPNFGGWLCGYSQSIDRVTCRVPAQNQEPQSKSIAVCTSDPTANPYLTMAAVLMAAIDGIQNKYEVGPPDRPTLIGETELASLPKSLWEAIDCLDVDRDFLLKGDVFSHELIDRWIDYKRRIERPLVEGHPTPAEFEMYHD